MIRLYGFGPGVGQPDLSPFVMKVMILLRMAALPFEKVDGIGGARKAPRGKLPYIVDEGRVVSDSRLIRRYLADAHGVDFSGGYDERTLMLGLLAERTLEESSYFIAVERRWIRNDGWVVMEKAAFGAMPAPIRLLVAPLVRRSIRMSLKGQGTARLSDRENDRLAAENTRAIACLLGDKPYFWANGPAGRTQRFSLSPSPPHPAPFPAPFATPSSRNPILQPIATGWPLNSCRNVISIASETLRRIHYSSRNARIMDTSYSLQ